MLNRGRLFLACLILPSSAVVTTSQAVAQVDTEAPEGLNEAERREVIENIAVASGTRYVDAAGGAKIAAYLRQRLAAGAYANLSDPVEFAASVTADLRTAVPDIHLRAVYEPGRSQPNVRVSMNQPNAAYGGSAGPRSFRRIDQRSEKQIARSNNGFAAVQRLDGNVGYLKIDRFVPLDMSSNTAAAAMAFLANSDALIVDLRGNIGGSPELVQQILSYFTGTEPVELITTYFREGDATTRLMSLAQVPGKRMAGIPLYVLIDSDTSSAAEMFAYIAQRKGLGTVVGQTSSGAGQGGNMLPAGSGISFFVPLARVVDGPGWEQTGVKPDVEVDSEHALEIAHGYALRTLVAAAAEPVVKREREWALELVTAHDQTRMLNDDLSDYAGRFGTRSFKVAGSELMVTSTGQPQALVRTGAEVFRLDNARYTFQRDAGGQVIAVKVETLSGTETRAAKTG